VADVLVGSLGIVAVAVIGALVLGAVLGAVLVFFKHRLGWGGPDRDAEDHISLTDRQ
jgi:ABC-type cobalt transport system substrate-binding protein